MLKTRVNNLILIGITIFLRLLSRRITVVPLWIGDTLYGVMIFFLLSFIHIHKSPRIIAAISLAFCTLIEFSQLYQAEWILNIRKTILGRLVLGQGFLWSDLFAYTLGIVAVSCIVETRKKKRE